VTEPIVRGVRFPDVSAAVLWIMAGSAFRIVPQFAGVFHDMNAPLPALTRAVLAVPPRIAISVAFLIAAAVFFRSRYSDSRRFEFLLQAIPILIIVAVIIGIMLPTFMMANLIQ
jgi:type II secretory pathway component PulF